MTTQVKICGLSTEETMLAALDAGADFVGLVFFAKSPRNVSLEKAGQLAALARGRAAIVTLTVDANDALIADIAQQVGPDWLQLHGSETPERIAAIRKLAPARILKAVHAATAADVDEARAYLEVADLLLYDAKPAPGAVLPGGNGLAFDWTILKHAPHPFMLAGGLTPENVAEAIRVTGADIVDVSSGVERAPGIKDSIKIAKFIEAAKAAR